MNLALKRYFLLFCFLSIGTVSAVAQKTWEKPYEKWSQDDAIKIVSASPWSVTYQSLEAAAASSQRVTSTEQRDSVNSGGGGRNAGAMARVGGVPPVVVRLHSGLPIRQAITRGRQIAAGYDKMDADHKKEFDDGSKAFLACAICKNYYVVSITKVPDSTSQTTEQPIFATFTLKDLKGDVWLVNDKGEQRELFQFTPPKVTGDAAYLFFARKDDKGNDLITSANKSFKLVFNNGFFATSNPYAYLVGRSFDFNVSKIIINDVIQF